MILEKLKKLVWLDLEMSGLDPDKSAILEIATIVTNSDLEIIAEGPSLIINCLDDKSVCVDPWVQENLSKLLEESRKSSTSIKEAESLTLDFLKEHLVAGESPLCGNSIWQDRRFLIKHMPTLNSFFHYRNIDVSTIKELIGMWYGFKLKKSDTHRAKQDILESINELKLYKKNYFIKDI